MIWKTARQIESRKSKSLAYHSRRHNQEPINIGNHVIEGRLIPSFLEKVNNLEGNKPRQLGRRVHKKITFSPPYVGFLEEQQRTHNF